MNLRNVVAIALSALLLGAAAQARAEPFISPGIASAKITASAAPAFSGSTSAPMHAAGYRFGDHLAIEVSYLDVELVRALPGNAAQSWRASGPGIAAIGALPIGGGFSLLGKVGAYRLDGESVTSGPAGAMSATRSSLGTRAAVGAGVLYALHPNVQLRAMLEHMRGGGELDRMRLATVGMVVLFR